MKIEMTENHKYTADGFSCVSVTTILKELGFVDFSKVPPEILEYASLRGTYTHKAIELYLQGKLNESTLDPAIQPYFQGFKKFASEYELKPLHLEKMFAIKHLLLAGTIDFIGFVDSKLTIIDYKTSAKLSKSAALQIGGYLLLANHGVKELNELIENVMVVQLKKDGTYSLMPKEWFIDCENKFMACLTVFHLLKTMKE